MDFLIIVEFFILLQLVTAKPNKVQMKSRIYPGNMATDGQFPYQGYFSNDELVGCSGSIIHPRWVLTAAHCIKDYSLDDPFFTVGTNDLFGSDGVSYDIEVYVIHRKYQTLPGPPPIVIYDIGLARLTSDIEFDNYKVQSIPLARDPIVKYENQTATVAGWGDSQYGQVSVLLFINIPIVPGSVCHLMHAHDDLHICGSNENQQQACAGDSGSPLVWNGQQIGITSVGDGRCKGLGPVSFTRVSTFVPWIQRVMVDYHDYI